MWHDVPVPQFDAADVRRYYDRHTSGFIAFGRGGSIGAIHRPVWGPGVQTRTEAFHYVDEQIADLIRRRELPQAAVPHVVDLGCGVGGTLLYLAERLPIRGTGITLSPLQARLATDRFHDAGLADRVVCLEGDYGNLPPAVSAADLAYAIESFAHSPDPKRFFAECTRLVRRGGLLAICDDVLRPAAGAAARRTVDRFVRGWHLNALLGGEELVALARAAGFEHESTIDLSPYVERPGARDRILDAALGWLPLAGSRLGPVLGGAALLKCLRAGWIGYELTVFSRT
jgi:SAM-dependent methyltransferase